MIDEKLYNDPLWIKIGCACDGNWKLTKDNPLRVLKEPKIHYGKA
jgi:hypothetical protein